MGTAAVDAGACIRSRRWSSSIAAINPMPTVQVEIDEALPAQLVRRVERDGADDQDDDVLDPLRHLAAA